ncbi:MAG TPA: inorganic phosphate transporter [Thermoplasmata archaeon]|nr:inorganic phosphate transporter [Thermoplasmata archaeon]
MILLSLLLVAMAAGFAYSLGAHYTGACMGMPYAAGAIRLVPALALMAPFVLLGAVLASGGVETTVGHGILASSSVAIPLALAIVASAFCLTSVYNFVRIPTSTIQILVFSVVGAGVADGIGIQWRTIETLLGVWAAAPFAACGLGFLFARLLDRRVGAPAATGRPAAPLARTAALALVGIGSAASFAMGANDVANASGSLVMTGLVGLFLAGLIGGVGMVLGVLTWGRPLLQRVAFDIVRLDARTAAASQLAQATVVLVSVSFGYFTSMNQALVGAMIGAGLARSGATVQRRTVRDILLGWGVGPVSGAALGGALVLALRAAHLL